MHLHNVISARQISPAALTAEVKHGWTLKVLEWEPEKVASGFQTRKYMKTFKRQL